MTIFEALDISARSATEIIRISQKSGSEITESDRAIAELMMRFTALALSCGALSMEEDPADLAEQTKAIMGAAYAAAAQRLPDKKAQS